jgi:nitrous oxide reductase accessory protein NosL
MPGSQQAQKKKGQCIGIDEHGQSGFLNPIISSVYAENSLLLDDRVKNRYIADRSENCQQPFGNRSVLHPVQLDAITSSKMYLENYGRPMRTNVRSFNIFIILVCLGCIMLFYADSPLAENRSEDGKGPRPAETPLTPEGRLQLGKADRCPVCGMFPAKRPKHAAGLELKDHRTFYFCGNGCLLRTLREPTQYLGVETTAILRAIVLDYYTGEPLDARTAFWVAGSDVVGPMGPALVVLREQKDVTTFTKRHGGRHIFRLDELDDALWRQLF